MEQSSHLFRQQTFAPLFWTQFLGAMNDNIFKNALIIMITYNASTEYGLAAGIMISICAALFILPYFLFSALAGQVTDKFEKSALIRLLKLCEVGIMMLAAFAFYFDYHPALLFILFLMGTQSTFFGPIKYSLLPEHIAKEQLLKANGIIEMGTFIAILVGTILGSLLITFSDIGESIISILVISIALLGYYNSRAIPKSSIDDQQLQIHWNILRQTKYLLREAYHYKTLFYAIIGLSWFWFFGTTYITLLPIYTKETLNGNEQIVTLLLTFFSLGIGLGSVACEKLSPQGKANIMIPIGAFGMSLFAADLFFTGNTIQATLQNQALVNLLMTIQSSTFIHLFIDIILIGFFAGLFIVPLYVLLQSQSPKKIRARMIAANNIVNALFMVLSSLLSMLLLKLSFSIGQIYLMQAGLNLVVTIWFIRKLHLQCPLHKELTLIQQPSE